MVRVVHTGATRLGLDRSPEEVRGSPRGCVHEAVRFKLDNRAEDYKDQVLDAGSRAQDAVLIFLKARGANAKGAGSVHRALNPLHKTGVLDERIIAYKRLLAIGGISGPAPVDTHDILAVVGHV
ncbi:hypothetical protein PC116_g4675 [Phytophthora cactorum]|uniref:Uncharacterized protein n=1 Tax=Phytophthora cactorum TaxID=29920 RepID=A0A8T0ZKX1_9STRA|nr:hypothetical protein Pcac1_g22692 [Phytophthora cactorum]KAG2844085.1 hypothetical protein PC112_g2343 [Phytophthora cactorum]KAG2862895.1 hypothetical protein PC113_g5930 [Phytophthora cactorum]KAG2930078.1 hypothetical protein PC114_g2566 [Phytophthora cactorum]KAG2933525.1 hypothetical protein PC115_g5487 [Phytophthora cactorum]